jgi:glycosyltransferase involved in cell wall biosynthesis
LRKNFIPEILAGSWQESRLRTAWYALILWGLHLTGCYRRISHWIAISGFMKEKFVEARIAPERITVLHHSWDAGPPPTESGMQAAGEIPYILFLGRLSREKGVDTLIDAWDQLPPGRCDGKLIIAGDGPLEYLVSHRAGTHPGIEFAGHVSGPQKSRLLREARAIVVPSRWWEPLGIVVYEAYDHAKTVLVAASGGLTETVIDRQTGLLHEPGNAGQLARQMREMLDYPEKAADLGRRGREHLLATTHPDAWLEHIEAILLKVVGPDAFVREASRTSPSAPVADTIGAGLSPSLDTISISVYLADQNPGHDRSFGISRMSRMILESLRNVSELDIKVVASKTSQQAPDGMIRQQTLPWGTRGKVMRLLTDHFHPLFHNGEATPDIHYFPKGYLPLLHPFCKPSVVTIHDTIIQYDEDHYPDWRKSWEYDYWAWLLKHTLRHADRILTVSESSQRQIRNFMSRHGIPAREITVTYEPCAYERIPQPVDPAKENYVVHLASCEPHKRTVHLLRWWHEAEKAGRSLPTLHLIGSVPLEVMPLLATARTIVKCPFLEDSALQAAYRGAQAVILPSEIEGFGLPALEAYYLGTPVCYVKGTSVEEVLAVATDKGGFALDDMESLFTALDEVMAMPPDEVSSCGFKLRETYAAEKVVERMLSVFHDVKN